MSRFRLTEGIWRNLLVGPAEMTWYEYDWASRHRAPVVPRASHIPAHRPTRTAAEQSSVTTHRPLSSSFLHLDYLIGF